MAAQPKDEATGFWKIEKSFVWQEAQRLAKAHGQGWHLPTKDELALLYAQRKVVRGFAYNSYWSSTEFSSNYAWFQDFTSGNQNSSSKSATLPVRAVRAF